MIKKHTMSHARSGGAMSPLMTLAELLRDIAEECSKSEIEYALGLLVGFADRVSGELEDAAEYPEPLGRLIAINRLRASKLRSKSFVGKPALACVRPHLNKALQQQVDLRHCKI